MSPVQSSSWCEAIKVEESGRVSPRGSAAEPALAAAIRWALARQDKSKQLPEGRDKTRLLQEIATGWNRTKPKQIPPSNRLKSQVGQKRFLDLVCLKTEVGAPLVSKLSSKTNGKKRVKHQAMWAGQASSDLPD